MPRVQNHTRAAFTLLELLVAIVIISVLIAILLPAMSLVQEAARATRCRAKLRDLGLAIRAYHDANDVFPLGMAYGTFLRQDSDSRSSSWSMQSFLLPYLEQHAVHDLINFNVNVNKYEGADINRTARLTKLNIFLCPSDPTYAFEHTGNSYVGSIGPDYYVVKPLGMFGSLLSVSDHDLRDGASHTIAMSERKIDWGILNTPGPGTVYTIGGNPKIDLALTDGDADRIPALDVILDRCQSSTTHFWYYNGRQWARGGLSWTLFNTIAPPNSGPFCRYGNEDAPWERGILPASSYHWGGVHVLLADGSVDFVNDGIDLALWRSMSTRAGEDQFKPSYATGGIPHVPVP